MTCRLCLNGWLDRGDVECVNGVLIDIDEAHEGGQEDVSYPPGPCQQCPDCKGTAFHGDHDCASCNGTGWKSGQDESQKRLKNWRDHGGDILHQGGGEHDLRS